MKTITCPKCQHQISISKAIQAEDTIVCEHCNVRLTYRKKATKSPQKVQKAGQQPEEQPKKPDNTALPSLDVSDLSIDNPDALAGTVPQSAETSEPKERFEQWKNSLQRTKDIALQLKGGKRIAYLLVSRITVFTTIGSISTLVMLVLMYPEIRALIAGFTLSTPVILKCAALLGFAIGMPVIYFLFGKTHGIQLALNHAISQNKSLLTEFAVQKFFETILENQEFVQNVKDHVEPPVNTFLKMYQRHIKGIPSWPLRMIAQFMISKIPIFPAIWDSIREQEISEVNLPSLQKASVAAVNQLIDETFSAPHLWWVWGIVLGHAGLFALLKWYYLS